MRNYLKEKSVQDGIVVFTLGLALGAYSLYSFTHAVVKAAWIMSPYLFPMLISCFAIGLGICLFAEGKRQADRRAVDGRRNYVQQAAPQKVMCVVGMSIVYLFLLPVLTFIPATMLLLYVLMSFMGEHRRRVKLLTSALVPLILYFLFAVGLGVRLP